jgi:hypothetical protein
LIPSETIERNSDLNRRAIRAGRVTRPGTRRSSTRAVERNEARRRQGWRLARTVVLGAAATVAALVWLGEQYGIERQVMFGFLGASVMFVAVLVVLGLGGTVLLGVIKKLLRRDR